MTIKVISIKSRKNPSRKRTAITTSKAPFGPSISASRNSRIRSSPAKPLKTSPNVVAPMRIIKIIEVRRVVVSTDDLRVLNENFPFIRVSKIAPAPPMAADSVGLATPENIDPSTAHINKIGGMRALKHRTARSFDDIACRSSRGIAGAYSGFRYEITAI